ncbi:MAG TPA: hypothetical protein VFI06_05525 [Chitinophagaceae bacterium]|nr:hypothetical protein [Chitinophagaceae bacterium]
MRLLILLFLSGISLIAAGQRKYHCEYKEMILFPMPDSAVISFKKHLEEQGIPPETAEQMVKQLKFPGILTSCWRKVDAGPDSTFILITKSNENDGFSKLDFPDEKLLFSKGEIYRYNSDKHKFLPDTVRSARRIFEKNGESKIILDHRCIVYTSTDSLCRIWVAEDLPEYINPGIRTDIKGAIIAYELKLTGQSIHAELAKIE